MEKHTKFRAWLHELWLRNCDEHRDYGEPVLTQQQYFQQYKYWLKREYRYQKTKLVRTNLTCSQG